MMTQQEVKTHSSRRNLHKVQWRHSWKTRMPTGCWWRRRRQVRCRTSTVTRMTRLNSSSASPIKCDCSNQPFSFSIIAALIKVHSIFFLKYFCNSKVNGRESGYCGYTCEAWGCSLASTLRGQPASVVHLGKTSRREREFNYKEVILCFQK